MDFSFITNNSTILVMIGFVVLAVGAFILNKKGVFKAKNVVNAIDKVEDVVDNIVDENIDEIIYAIAIQAGLSADKANSIKEIFADTVEYIKTLGSDKTDDEKATEAIAYAEEMCENVGIVMDDNTKIVVNAIVKKALEVLAK